MVSRGAVLVGVSLILGACGSENLSPVSSEAGSEPVPVDVVRYNFEGQEGVEIVVKGTGAELIARAEALIPDSRPSADKRVGVGGEVSGAPEVYRDYRDYDYAVYDITGPLCGVAPTLYVEKNDEDLLELRVQHPKTDPDNEGCEAAEFDFVVGIDFMSHVEPSVISQVRAN